jgi:hypothetical protein
VVAALKNVVVIPKQQGRLTMTENVASPAAVVERRKARRLAVDWDVVVRGLDQRAFPIDEAAHLENLSSRGAFLYLTRQLAIGTRVRLRIRMPVEDERWMLYTGDVVRVEEGPLGFGTALRFSRVRPEIEKGLPRKTSSGR